VKSKKSVAKKPHKPWLGDLVLTPKPASAWFNDILIACKRLPQCLEGVSFARFSASRPHQDAAMRHIQQIGEAGVPPAHQGQAAAPGCRLESPGPPQEDDWPSRQPDDDPETDLGLRP